MSENFEQLDGVFRKQLSDFSQSVPGEVWGKVEQALDSQRIRKKGVTIYKIAAAILAFTVIGSGYLYWQANTGKKVGHLAVVKDAIQQKIVKKTIPNHDEGVKDIYSNNNKPKLQHVENKKLMAKVESIEKKSSSVETVIPSKESIEPKEVSFERIKEKQISITTNKISLAIVDTRAQKVKSILNTLPDIYSSYALNDLTQPEKDRTVKWALGGEFSPLYSYRNITSSGGGHNQNYYNSVEKPIMSYTGGLNVQYKAVGRITIQAGVYYTTMGQSLDYMAVYANSAYNLVNDKQKGRFINVYSIDNSLGDVSFNSPYVIVDEKSARVNNLSTIKGVADVSEPIYNNLDAEIQQYFRYVEVPFLMRYKLIDKNFDLNIIGGFGANFLVGNDVYLKYGDNKEIIGETNGVSSINYNGTIGFGIEYPLLDRINFRLEPSVKYYLNEINSKSEVESHPYSIGIYTGISYSF